MRGRSRLVTESHAVSVRTRDRLTASVFGGVAACALGVMYWVSRIGFANPARPVIVTAGLALFVVCGPAIIATRSDTAELRKGAKWWRMTPFLAIASLLLTAVAGTLVYPLGVNMGVPIASVGLAAFLVVIGRWARGARFTSATLVVGVAFIFAAWIGGTAWGTRYKTPLFWELISDRGNVHHDPLYYVSMANSMRAYGVPSTALDGVPYTPYHYGSAWLNSQWADLAGVDVLTFYSLGPTVFVAPVFFFALLLLAGEARSAWRLERPNVATELPLERDWLPWLVLVAAAIGVIPGSALDALAIWNRHVLISESYLTGLAVFLLCCALSIDWWICRDKHTSRSDAAFLFLVVPALLACLGFLKVSLMLLSLAGLIWILTRSGLFRDRGFLLSSAVALLVSAVTFRLVSVHAQNQGFAPLSFMRESVNPSWWPYFLLGHFFWSCAYIALRIHEEKTPTLGDLWTAVRAGRLIDVEIVAVIAICGLLPGELIAIHGGSAVYFSDVQRWLAAPLTMAIAARSIARPDRRPGRFLSSVRMSTVVVAFIAIPITLTIFFNVSRAVRNAALMNIGLRNTLASYSGLHTGNGIVGDSRVLETGLRKAPDYAMISALRALDGEPRATKRRTLLFIPQSDSAFWNVYREPDRCSFASFVGPATSGHALLDGMPPASCDLTDQYGMPAYHRRTQPQSAAEITPLALCAKAKQKGFTRVIILHRDQEGSYSTPAFDC